MMADDPLLEEWKSLASWWIAEGSRDGVYAEVVLPWLADLLGDPTGWILDLGCGEGQAMRHLSDARMLGCDANAELLAVAVRSGAAVRCELPYLEWLKEGVLGGAIAMFVMEHIRHLEPLFAEAARVTRQGGCLVAIGNHPAYTAPGAGPLVDETDGEVLWRWGPYLSEVVAVERVGPGTVTFHHRPLSIVLTAAADAGWSLERFDERSLTPAIVGHPALAGQEHFPRMFGARWRLL